MILSKCELQLRRNGIAVGKRSDGMTSGVHLYVNCGITGRAFANTIEFKRNVTYRVGAVQHSSLATTYRRAGQGIATDGKFVIECLIDLVDVFSNDFIKSNSTK